MSVEELRLENKEKEEFKILPKLEKSGSKKNGKLFKLSNIWKSHHYNDEEKAYSTGNIFKQIFITVMATLMCFFSFSIFESANRKIENKIVDDNTVYLDMRTYPEIRKLDTSLYDNIDFFELNYTDGNFAYKHQQSISSLTVKYAPTKKSSTLMIF